jgi:hypothetical protein
MVILSFSFFFLFSFFAAAQPANLYPSSLKTAQMPAFELKFIRSSDQASLSVEEAKTLLLETLDKRKDRLNSQYPYPPYPPVTIYRYETMPVEWEHRNETIRSAATGLGLSVRVVRIPSVEEIKDSLKNAPRRVREKFREQIRMAKAWWSDVYARPTVRHGQTTVFKMAGEFATSVGAYQLVAGELNWWALSWVAFDMIFNGLFEQTFDNMWFHSRAKSNSRHFFSYWGKSQLWSYSRYLIEKAIWMGGNLTFLAALDLALSKLLSSTYVPAQKVETFLVKSDLLSEKTKNLVRSIQKTLGKGIMRADIGANGSWAVKGILLSYNVIALTVWGSFAYYKISQKLRKEGLDTKPLQYFLNWLERYRAKQQLKYEQRREDSRQKTGHRVSKGAAPCRSLFASFSTGSVAFAR